MVIKMATILERNRARLINAYLSDLVNKTGKMIAPVKLPNGKTTTVLLDSEILNKALIKLFEAPAKNGDLSAEKKISDTYSECIRIKSGKLSSIGEGFMEALVSNLTEQAFTKWRDK